MMLRANTRCILDQHPLCLFHERCHFRYFKTCQKKLEAAGFPAKQAADTAEALAEVMVDGVATKTDLELLKRDLTIRTGTMLTAAVAVITALVKLL